MSNRNIKVVRVTKDDYDQVCAITPPGQIYSGTDYLPDYFHMLLDMSNVEAYAAVVDGKFASFFLSFVVDNGRTVVTRAGRTNKEYAGMGLQDVMRRNTIKDRKYDKMAATSGAHVKAILDQIKSGKREKILMMEFRSYITSGDQLKSILNTIGNTTPSSAKPIDAIELGDILTNQQVSCHLFPESRVIVDWVPYRLIKSNAFLIKTIRTTVIGSNLENGTRILTFGNYFNTTAGLVCNIEVYGCIGETLAEHLYLHLRELISHEISGKVIIRCFYRQETKSNFITKLMNRFGLDITEIWGTGLVCTETTPEIYFR
ncbi:histidine N-acetyltransferase-like [Mytilus californianus]|uniref:histidine N-acetyltransferase-like n=1 Tax=Mytilus californianus TaxID=6549 RepID=UPI002245F8A8|nr:histidine N-acetyltransferase-like [Mytilus californianus]